MTLKQEIQAMSLTAFYVSVFMLSMAISGAIFAMFRIKG